MISAKKLIKMARKRITFRGSNEQLDIKRCTSMSSVVEKGHFVVYTIDQKRFVMPLSYLNSNILRELFKMSEEEFQVLSDGPIMLPCDTSFMEYVLTLIQRGAAKDIKKALLKSINCSSCSLSSGYHHLGFPSQPSLVYGY